MIEGFFLYAVVLVAFMGWWEIDLYFTHKGFTVERFFGSLAAAITAFSMVANALLLKSNLL